jgi:hypothetical protein
VVPGATVTAVNEGNGDQRQTTSNANGYYVVPNLVVGAYTVSTEAAGFKSVSQTGVKLSSAAKISVDLELTVGATASAPATVNHNGSFRFLDTGNPRTTGLAVANTLLGDFNDYSELSGKPLTPWIATALDLFAQDSWKATRKLTLEYGVRYSLWPPWHSRWGSLAMFQPDFYDPKKAGVVDRAGGFIVSGDPYNGIVLPGCKPPEAEGNRFPALHTGEFDRLYQCLPDGLSQTQKLLFQPRVGAAYALNSRTAIRSGLGMFANMTMINRDTALGGNAPFQLQQTVVNGVVDAPGGATKRDFPFTMTIQDPVFEIPVAWNWNFTGQRELPGSMTVEVGYVGWRGIHNQRKRNINQLQPGAVQANAGVNPNFLRPYHTRGWEFWGFRRTRARRCITACRSASSGGSARACSSVSPILSPRQRTTPRTLPIRYPMRSTIGGTREFPIWIAHMC